MAKTVSSWSQLQKVIQEKIDSSLENEVAEHTKDEIQSSLSEVVYSSYEPKIYERRKYGDGGLGDRETMDSKLVKSGELEVIPNALSKTGGGLDNDYSLAYNIVYGYGNRNQPWNKPRDFVENARENLRNDGSLREVMVDALRKRGLDAQ